MTPLEDLFIKHHLADMRADAVKCNRRMVGGGVSWIHKPETYAARYGPEIREEARKMIAEGVGYEETSRRLGPSPTVIRGWVKAAGGNSGNETQSIRKLEKQAEARRLWDEGRTVASIAKRIGRSHTSVRSYLRDYRDTSAPRFRMRMG